jgi:hypothetical protein
MEKVILIDKLGNISFKKDITHYIGLSMNSLTKRKPKMRKQGNKIVFYHLDE